MSLMPKSCLDHGLPDKCKEQSLYIKTELQLGVVFTGSLQPVKTQIARGHRKTILSVQQG